MRNELINMVRNVVEEELAASMKKFPLFNSPHEGSAVIREELEETIDEIARVLEAFRNLWNGVKYNEWAEAEGAAIQLKTLSTLAACEIIQTAAMAQKYINSVRG